MGGGGRARETHLDKDSEGTGCEEEHPETANSLSGTHSAAEAKPAFHPEARECPPPRCANAGALQRARRGGRARKGLSSSGSRRSKAAGQIPPPGAARPIHLAGEVTLPGRSKGRRGEIQAFGGSRQVFGGEGGAWLGRMRREGRCCPFKRR